MGATSSTRAAAAMFDKMRDRLDAFTKNEAKSRADLDAATERIAEQGREKQRLEKQIGGMNEQIQALLVKVAATRQQEAFQSDEPHGRITRRLPEGIVELNIGSDALVRPGLTFTVLPYDFPEKGRQSRMRTVRVPDGKGGYRNEARFIEKATLEVTEVVGPNLSRCRITQEFDPIRDGVIAGDLLYKPAGKGTASHVAAAVVRPVPGVGQGAYAEEVGVPPHDGDDPAGPPHRDRLVAHGHVVAPLGVALADQAALGVRLVDQGAAPGRGEAAEDVVGERRRAGGRAHLPTGPEARALAVRQPQDQVGEAEVGDDLPVRLQRLDVVLDGREVGGLAQ